MKIVEKLKFLGSVVPNLSDDVKRRIVLANSTVGRLIDIVLLHRDSTVKLKLRLCNA